MKSIKSHIDAFIEAHEAVARSNGRDAPWLMDEAAPSDAAVIADAVVKSENPVRESVVTHEPPHILNQIELSALWLQRHHPDVSNVEQRVTTRLSNRGKFPGVRLYKVGEV